MKDLCSIFISLKHSLSLILCPTVNGSIVQPLFQKLQTDTAFGTDSLSSIMYCKWIKLMHPSPFCCWTVFISLIYIHKSYSVSQLHLLCCRPSEKCKYPAITARYLSDEQICVTLSSSVWAKCFSVSIYVLTLFFSSLSSFKIYYLTDHGRKCVLFPNSRVQCTLQPLFSSLSLFQQRHTTTAAYNY